MSLVDDLKAAKALIDAPEKWRQDGSFGFGTGCFCVLGAVATAAQEDDACGAARDYLEREVPGMRSVVVYNDDPSTTHADIMALFDRAIANAALSTAESK